MAETTRGPSFPPIVGAEMPTLVRAKDWAATPLGPMEAWSATLKLALEMVLSSGFPMALRWGPEFVLIYNDGYRPILGDKHPWALGLPAREAWSEVWDQLDPVHNEILSGQRGAVFSENTPLQIKRRRDQWENAFFTLSYSPIADPTVAGGIGGILVTAVETTDSMRGEAALRESDERLQRALSVGLGIGTWDWDVQNDRVVADARFARLCGVDPEHAARGAPIEEFFFGMHPGDRERVQASIASALGSGADFYEEYRLVRPDGSERWVAAQGRCMLGAEGKAVRFPGVTFDITSRKKSEARNQALLDLDNRLRSLEDVADVAFAAAEVLGRTLNVSRAGYGSIDLEAETITIERDWNAPGIKSLAGVLKFRDYGSYIEELKQGRTVVIEDAVSDPRTASGAAALAGISALSLVNMPVTEQGGFVALLYLNHASARDWPEEDLVLVREVAERARMAIGRRTAEHELRTLNANLERQVLERSHVGGRTWQLSTDILGVANAEGFFESSNPAWQTILGWSREEVARTPLFDFIHPDDFARTQGALNQLMQGDPVFRFDNRYRTKTGDYRWLSWVAVPESGKFYCSARDVTIDKQRDEALAATVAERDRIWRNSRDLITVIDLRGILTSINPAVSAHLGWTPKDMIGRNVLEFIHPEDRPPLHGDTFIPERYAEPRVFFNRFLHKDGSWRHMSWLAALSEEQLIYSSGRDVTVERQQAEALKVAEESLRQAQKMEAVGQLTGGIAHDFNNMLAIVIAGIDLANRRLERNEAGAKQFLDSAREGATRAATLTRRLLAFSRQSPLDPKVINLNTLVSSMSDLLRRTLGERIELETVLIGGPWRAHVDPNGLESAIINLALNARDAMPEGGKLTIETANILLDERYAAGEVGLKAGQYVMVAVSDVGEGIAPEIVDKVFDPFFTTKPVGKGTGLGLSMVYGFAKQSGGHVRIYSELGRGTSVKIYVPRHFGTVDAETGVTRASTVPLAANGSETVFVVEDEDRVRQMSCAALQDLGYTVYSASSGEQALEIFDQIPRVDVVFTDIVMGGMTGRQLADALRVKHPDVRILYTTGYTRNAVVHNGVLDPGVALLSKPFSVEDLARKLRAVLDA